jgi:hypothetical protein
MYKRITQRTFCNYGASDEVKLKMYKRITQRSLSAGCARRHALLVPHGFAGQIVCRTHTHKYTHTQTHTHTHTRAHTHVHTHTNTHTHTHTHAYTNTHTHTHVHHTQHKHVRVLRRVYVPTCDDRTAWSLWSMRQAFLRPTTSRTRSRSWCLGWLFSMLLSR